LQRHKKEHEQRCAEWEEVRHLADIRRVTISKGFVSVFLP
jgi:hypothetical protein